MTGNSEAAPRRFRHRVAIVTVGTATHAVLLVGFGLLNARWLAPSDRGVVVLFLTVSTLATFVGTLGFNVVGRSWLASTDEAVQISVKTYLNTARKISLLQSLAMVPLSLVVLLAAGAIESLGVGLLVTLYLPVFSYAYLMRDGLYGLGRFVGGLSGDVLFAVSAIVGTAVLHALGTLNDTGTLCVLMASVTLEALYLRMQYAPIMGSSVGQGRRVALLQAVRAGIPAVIMTLGHTVALRAPRLIVGLAGSPAESALFGVAAVFAEASSLVAQAVAQVVFRDAPQDGSLRRLRRLLVILLPYWIVATAVLATCGPSAIVFLVGEEYSEAGQPSVVLAFSVLPLGVYLLMTAHLNGIGDFQGAARAGAAGGAAVVVLVPLGTVVGGLSGAAIASLLAYWLMAAVSAGRLVRRRLRGPASGGPEA